MTANLGYYDGVIFHRVVPGFVAQTGDPHGDGSGGESIYGTMFDDELVGRLSHNRRGIVSMASSGHNTNGSQFFFTFRDCTQLDGTHTIFGYVDAKSLSVLDEIEVAKTKHKRPVNPIKIFTATVCENPWQDQPLPPGAYLPDKPLVEEKEKKCIIS